MNYLAYQTLFSVCQDLFSYDFFLLRNVLGRKHPSTVAGCFLNDKWNNKSTVFRQTRVFYFMF
jgi:hypothetical protein